ncbi:MAG: type II secretion system F family protein [Planctomycetes bacterium]|nr:type II secretion system F family protein [Planctomycetota bacterium]
MLLLLETSTKLFAIIALWLAAIAIGTVIVRRWRARELARRRAWAEEEAIDTANELDVEDLASHSFLRRWLYLAGFRKISASSVFIIATGACCIIGGLLALVATQTGVTTRAVAAASEVPGGIADLARPVLIGAPWILIAIFALLPWSYVNNARKRRVREIEQDMPVTLELLATMSESGMAFDGALDKVIGSSATDRPLFRELRTFQLETLGGVSRLQCFRRLARRVEVPSLSLFTSALVQAEQIGSGFTKVLRNQADDLRSRRREDANMLAQALTVKLVFPLVLCFLPGIFVSTLGPTFLQFIKLTDSLSSGR